MNSKDSAGHNQPTTSAGACQPSRRSVIAATLGGAALWLARDATAQVVPPGPPLDERDPQAVALGYVKDARRVEAKRFPKYKAGEHCAGCQLYRGAPTLPQAPCTVFDGKQVAGPGWCTAFAPR